MSTISVIEDFISFRAYQVWYRIVKPDQEDSKKLPCFVFTEAQEYPTIT